MWDFGSVDNYFLRFFDLFVEKNVFIVIPVDIS